MNKDIACPYCNIWQEVCHDDGQGYEEDKLHQQTCRNCDKVFVFTTSIHFSYEAEKAECLNDGNHNYKPTTTFPRKYSKMRCISCGEERQPTKEELEEIIKGDKKE